MSIDIAAALRLKLGALNVVDGHKTPFGARIAAFPGTEEEAVETVARAAQASIPVLPVGGGTYVDALAPVPSDVLLLSSVRLNRVLEYHPEDLVVTAEAGTPISALQHALRRHRQFLPLNPPDADAATVGGVVAAAATGPWRAAYGATRDYVLEVRVADPLGRLVRGGARVVKNVAGYDLPKLYTGSRGTLGFITQVTLKVRPLPEQVTRLLFSASTWDAIFERLSALASSDIRATSIEVARQDLRDPSERPCATITLEGGPETVQWQTTACMELLRCPGAMVGRVEEAPALPRSGDVELSIRVRPTDSAAAMTHLLQARWRGAALATPLDGRIIVRTVAHPDTPERLADLRAWVESRGGTVTVERMPRSWTGHVSPWGTPRTDAILSASIKAHLDPNRLFTVAQAPGI